MAPLSTLGFLGTQPQFPQNEGSETWMPAHSGFTLCSAPVYLPAQAHCGLSQVPSSLLSFIFLGPHIACLSYRSPFIQAPSVLTWRGLAPSFTIPCAELAPPVLSTLKVLAFMAAENLGAGTLPSECSQSSSILCGYCYPVDVKVWASHLGHQHT